MEALPLLAHLVKSRACQIREPTSGCRRVSQLPQRPVRSGSSRGWSDGYPRRAAARATLDPQGDRRTRSRRPGHPPLRGHLSS